MADLIERLRDASADAAAEEYGVSGLLTEAAAALEAAREDAAEAKQNGYELGLLAGAQEAERLRGVIARYERKLDAAIDQARGKGGGEVGP